MARTQAQRSETTTTALVDAARDLFASDGYLATSLDAVVARAGVTKGALYHHFAGKRELFAAVYEREQVRQAEVVAAAYARKRDPWDAFQAGCRAFLEHTLDPGVQRIALIDAPGALGWERVRELEHGALLQTEIGLRAAIDAGAIPKRPVGPLAQLLFGALCEAAMSIARADDQAAAMRAIQAELKRLFTAIASG